MGGGLSAGLKSHKSSGPEYACGRPLATSFLNQSLTVAITLTQAESNQRPTQDAHRDKCQL